MADRLRETILIAYQQAIITPSQHHTAPMDSAHPAASSPSRTIEVITGTFGVPPPLGLVFLCLPVHLDQAE